VAIGLLFPGQGSQSVGMTASLCAQSSAAREVVQRADRALSFSLTELMWNGPEDRLRQTEFAQPALLVAGVAAHAALQQSVAFDFAAVAGHSLGEYTGLVVADAITLEEGVQAVHRRGQLMQQAAGTRASAMAAVIGLSASEVEDVVQQHRDSGAQVWVAAINTPQQVTISGLQIDVEGASEALREKGARRVVPLSVSAPFHSGLMQPAVEPFDEVLRGLTVTQPGCALVRNVDAQSTRDPKVIVQGLREQLTQTVRWSESVVTLIANLDCDLLLELGSNKVLSAMVRKVDRQCSCVSVYDAESLASAARTVGDRFCD